MTTNASRIFNFKKNEYQNLNNTPFPEVNGNTKINGISYKEYFSIEGAETIELFVQYPGLVIGTGYPHFADGENDFQMGFFFDHTTGMPVIPGSSVKGILKRVFPKKNEDNDKVTEKKNYLHEKIPALQQFDEDIWDWEKICFERRQVFCDAYISKALDNNKIFADDYCTKHGDNIFKEPVPLRFLKIASGVQITFQFILYDYTQNNKTILKKDILDGFKSIIQDFGIGAKRNYGYGNLKEKTQNVAKSV